MIASDASKLPNSAISASHFFLSNVAVWSKLPAVLISLISPSSFNLNVMSLSVAVVFVVKIVFTAAATTSAS